MAQKITEKQYKAAITTLIDHLRVTQTALAQIYNWPANEDNAKMVGPIFNDNKWIIEQIRKKIPK